MHFLRKDELFTRRLRKSKAVVSVRLNGNSLVVGEDQRVGVADESLEWAKLPERISVVDPDGNALKASPETVFYVSLETFNPYHLLTEAKEEEMRW